MPPSVLPLLVRGSLLGEVNAGIRRCFGGPGLIICIPCLLLLACLLQAQVMTPDRAAKDEDLANAKHHKGSNTAVQFFGDASKAWCGLFVNCRSLACLPSRCRCPPAHSPLQLCMSESPHLHVVNPAAGYLTNLWFPGLRAAQRAT